MYICMIYVYINLCAWCGPFPVHTLLVLADDLRLPTGSVPSLGGKRLQETVDKPFFGRSL